ncbi:hypothetical protein K469DRAFT_555725, partial [Zopfia rhizophila CBS 207.26]
LEPQWNPSIEEQALARIHRMGQKRAVITIRYVMAESFEEDILSVQDRKKLLVDWIMSGKRTVDGGDGSAGAPVYG